MRRVLLPLLALGACVTTALPVSHGPITTADAFRATVAGKTVANADTTVTIQRNGTLSGSTKGTEISGVWEFRDGQWCRTITAPAPSAEDCQLWRIDGNLVTIQRDSGKGETLRFRVATAG